MKKDALQWVSSVHITPPKMAKMAPALIDSKILFENRFWGTMIFRRFETFGIQWTRSYFHDFFDPLHYFSTSGRLPLVPDLEIFVIFFLKIEILKIWYLDVSDDSESIGANFFFTIFLWCPSVCPSVRH